jgi:argininosuccinate synthase
MKKATTVDIQKNVILQAINQYVTTDFMFKDSYSLLSSVFRPPVHEKATRNKGQA